jgi:hypothetical protein
MMVFQRDPYIRDRRLKKGLDFVHQHQFILVGRTAHRYYLLLAQNEISARLYFFTGEILDFCVHA